MKQNTKPVITLKNIKHAEFASEETNCYSATIYVNGKRFATVSNDGFGGSDHVQPFSKNYQDLQDLEKQIASTYPKWGSEFGGSNDHDTTLEIICGDLVNEWLKRKDFKKAMRRILYMKPQQKGLYQCPAKLKPSAAMIAAIKEKASWAKGCVFLNELPETEAMSLYFANA
tara:strand:- start:208 stop:720 length:513 start_codon:yes stop_codon:yes gene_type:complete